jgi:hypothetical protein
MDLIFFYSVLGIIALIMLIYNLIALKRDERRAGL